jgi:cytosine/adenosine deaminase-related metal-dependent hydrolase
MKAYRAAWICPIDQPPIKDGIIAIADGTIRAVGKLPVAPTGLKELGNVALMPGLVNAHTHLELSWLRGRVPPAERFTDWVKLLFAIRGRPDRRLSDEQLPPIREAIRESKASGTIAVGDISNSLAAVEAMLEAKLHGVVFHELLGFNERDAALVTASKALRDDAAARGVRVSLAPHAPYSTSLELFSAIRIAVNGSACPMMSVHLAESAEEVEFLEDGSGPWRSMLEMLGLWRDDWTVPGCDPVTYLDRHDLIDANTLVVHGVQLEDAALNRLAAIGATLVTCPRSNLWVGAGEPPIARFYQSGVKVAVGTDSLASVGDLNVFSELTIMRRLAPEVPAAKILESATLAGANALGLGRDLGSLTPGKRAEMIAVRLPEGVVDVEEFLLSGVQPAQIEFVAI